MNRAIIAAVICLMWAGSALSQSITLEQAMAHPDWIGRAPQQAYWADDSRGIYYRQKRQGTEQTDLFRVDTDGDELRQVAAEDLPSVDVPSNTRSPNGRLKTYARAGDIYVKNLRSGDITQLTRTAAQESNPVFTADNDKVIFSRNSTILVRDLDSGLEYQAADIRLEPLPDEEEEKEYLEEQQLRLFDIISLQQERQQLTEKFDNGLQRSDATRLAPPYYLGEDKEIVSSTLSPNEKWLIVTLRDSSKQEDGRVGTMPNYVTASGYVETREVRSRVGTTDFANQDLFLFDLNAHEYARLDLADLPALQDSPLQIQLSIDPDEEQPTPREVYFSGIRWAANGERVLFQAISRDNKDRWLLSLDTTGLELETSEGEDLAEATDSLRDSVDLESPHLELVHHNHDPAWINRQFIQADWLPDNESFYFLSEEHDYGHLNLYSSGTTRQLTRGDYEVREPLLSKSGDQIYFRGNIQHPTIYEVYRVEVDSGEIQQLTELGGMNRFNLSPDESHLLVLHSSALQPLELYTQNTRANSRATRITHTISDEFDSVDWAQPEFVEIPSSHVADPIHSRVYTPDDANSSRPAVVFIHGAGYLQNAHQGWSSYFREFMFHSFLVQQGYVVLDMDYRASSGYGRDWRTAIYQQMGTPEVQDLADGIDWLVANKNVNRDRICTYGGSYGGFLTLMALFTEPDLFACGAALRPVTDWAAYNHGYTSNILNIPEIDPEAYQRSSPIEFAAGLSKPLLIAHGMQDNNVFFQDSVRLVQRLIELEKQNWEIAIYPIEAHGFREPSSWLDEYRRIYSLFEEQLR
ncbi:MAG: prolyl oligopeptidase family serine peptidase [Gammaproteobacteria bacterium]|jgi:dipeptidyl aminopeptidase/acylaminoacyl peptidase|nr:prolyl oligopeptidase family serine peptidase [Gammaproteobacteria bacterium]MDP6732417.1 prolyl oligopeptidase family serine peptidase [Gammaproteobacteria bacterium]